MRGQCPSLRCDLPVVAQVSVDEALTMADGTPVATMGERLKALGCDVIGVNCGDGPQIVYAAVEKLLYHDPDRHRPDLANLTDDQLAIMLRNRETTALLTWEPFMHNPKLRHRLHRARCPTLFLRGESDGLVSAPYLQGYAALLPDAHTITIASAGHLPQQEQPAAFVAAVMSFLDA